MATKLAAGSTKNGRDSIAKRLGVKATAGQYVSAGSILVRQRGTKYFGGENTGMGRDHTIYAMISGRVAFSQKKMTKFDGRTFRDTVVSVEALSVEEFA